MSESKKVSDLIQVTTDRIRALADADTIIGEPIVVDGVTLLPVSKASFGLGAGGSDIPSKQTGSDYFGGGCGAGISITPVAFLAIKNGEVKLMQIYKDSSPADKAIGLLPDLFDKVTDMFHKKETGTSVED